MDRLRDLVDDRLSTSQLADWEDLAWEYALTVRDRTDVIEDLAQDLLALQRLTLTAPGHEARDWERVNARMTFLLAFALGSAGSARESRRWWASARRSAARADDTELLGTVNAVEAVQALYEERPLPVIMARIEEALAVSKNQPWRAPVSAYGAKAHLLALLGDHAAAAAALDDQARAFERLPNHIVQDTASLYGWPVERLLHSRSLVYTLAGHPEADAARREAMAAYPRTEPRQAARARQIAQVELHQSIAEVRRGDVLSGLDHARDTLAALPPADHSRYVRRVAATVLESLPEVDRERPAAVEYRTYLQLPPGKRA
ncbi:hypothetical protein [Nonomuraea sp. NPDC002799]